MLEMLNTRFPLFQVTSKTFFQQYTTLRAIRHIKTPASGLEPEHQKNLITQRLAISCLTKLGLYRHIVGGEGLEPPVPKPRIYSPLHYQFCSSTYERRTQDLHMQVAPAGLVDLWHNRSHWDLATLSDQLFSRRLPHHPDIRHIFLLYNI